MYGSEYYFVQFVVFRLEGEKIANTFLQCRGRKPGFIAQSGERKSPLNLLDSSGNIAGHGLSVSHKIDIEVECQGC